MRLIQKRFTSEAKQLIKKLAPDVKAALRALTDEIAESPTLGKELKKKLKGFRSGRYGNYRVIYEYFENKNLVIIHYLGRRKDVYVLFERLLKLPPISTIQRKKGRRVLELKGSLKAPYDYKALRKKR